MKYIFQVLALCALAGTSGCSWLGIGGDEPEYLSAGSLPPTRIPDSLDEPPFIDLMEIPQVVDSRGIAGKRFTLELPEPLSSGAVEQIVLKTLGDDKWLFVDAPLAIVWPRILAFCEENNVPVVSASPRRGLVESAWIVSKEGEAESVIESIVGGASWADPQANSRNRFLFRLEPGIRPQSTELHVRHQRAALEQVDPNREPGWYTLSDNLPLEHAMLTSVAYALGDSINETVSFSRLAAELQGDRAEVVADRERPTLRYKLDFDRTWATVNGALNSARIEVEDLDRSSKVFYVYYTDNLEAPGLFRRWFGLGARRDEQNRYELHLAQASGEVHVSVHKSADELADPAIAERLLKTIKQYSS